MYCRWKNRRDSSVTRFAASKTRSTASNRTIRRPGALVLTMWATVISVVVSVAVNMAVDMAVSAADGGMAGRWTSALRRRFTPLRSTRDAGLTTVEVAIITAVLLGLATALVAAITVVVNRNTSKIQ